MTLTDGFIVAWMASWIAYDFWAMRNRRANDTISHRVVVYCRCYPWLALLILAFVVLCAGHWFLPYDYHWIWPQPVFVSEK